MSKIFKWAQGKKTYITAIVIGISAGLKAIDIEIPEWVFEMLAGLGLVTLRAGVANSKK